MELFNSVNDYLRDNDEINVNVAKEVIETYVKLIAPLAPHFTEELWEKLGKSTSVHKEEWPEINESEMKGGTKDIPVQVNGKLKFCVTVDADASNDEIYNVIKNSPQVIELHEKNDVKKEIYVPGRIYNLVISK